MADPIKNFGDSAKTLSRNPLGIIALFIVLVYGVAGLVVGFTDSLSTSERLPLIYFLIIFPVLVLSVFAWLVSRHSNKLFAPGDFRNDENYMKVLNATVSLTAASMKGESPASPQDLDAVVATIREIAGVAERVSEDASWRRCVLWVDDRPEATINERNAFEALGLSITLALSTAEALRSLEQQKYAVIISDMGRREGPREGYVLLDRIRDEGNNTPFFVYSSSNLPEHRREVVDHGGQGATHRPQELFEMVMRAIVRR